MRRARSLVAMRGMFKPPSSKGSSSISRLSRGRLLLQRNL